MQAANYSSALSMVEGVECIKLSDAGTRTEVSVVTGVGNIALDLRVNGTSILWAPTHNAAAFAAKPALGGVPLLSPWANRLDSDGTWANGRRYPIHRELGNIRGDQNGHPIHGLVSFTKRWKVITHGSDERGAWVTSRLEFWRSPEWMAQFPFAHSIEVTYRLSNGVLEVLTRYENQSDEPMPLVVGYHPYFQIPGVSREEWQVRIPAREHVQLSPALIPTGERVARDPAVFALRNVYLDDVYTGIEGDREFWVEGGGKRIAVSFGSKYTVGVVYAPKGREFICFEPMTGITNGANLAHEGKYPELQSIPPGGVWEERFAIRPSGF